MNKLIELKKIVELQLEQGIQDCKSYLHHADANCWETQRSQNDVYRWVLHEIEKLEYPDQIWTKIK